MPDFLKLNLFSYQIVLGIGDSHKTGFAIFAAVKKIQQWGAAAMRRKGPHPGFFDEQSGPTVGAIDYVRGSGN